MKRLLGAALIIILSTSSTCQKADNSCESKVTCGECIRADSRCAWCALEDFSIDDARCDFKEKLLKKCDKNFLVYPENTVKTLKAKHLTDSGPNNETIQVKPQHISITARPKSPVKIKVYFRQAENYPVDLYYLMDLSYTMKDDKVNLASLGTKFAETMGKITTKFHLGFGSFVDKTALPFTDTSPNKLEQPCYNEKCAKPYGFRNHMSLETSTSKFSREVNDADVSGNLDAPEGGFDAIMQVAVCRKLIGWRNESRKLLVFATDSGFHYAGDGRLAGIMKPNDGKCHLDNSGYYTESLVQDYPSIRHLNQKIEENNINVIFAVTKDAEEIYKDLTLELKGSTTGRLSNDSSNVIELIRKQYDQIVSTIEMRDNADKDVRVTYYSQCLRHQRERTSKCTSVKLGYNVTFDVEIEVISCPADKKERKKQFKISPVGLNEALIVDLEIICECDCEKEGKKEINSPRCSSGNGSFECGICNCYSNRYGRKCQCDGTESNDADADSTCRKDNSTNKVCSQRGDCRCGVCECRPRKDPSEKIYGKYCECDNFSCNKKDNQLCGGPDKGKCECGLCRCNPGWKGPDCSCRDSEENCKSQDGKICSGHGICTCNICKCTNEGEEYYSGFLCEECPTCPDKCNIYKSCAECLISNNTSVEFEDTCSNCSYAIDMVDNVEANSSRERICTFPDSKNCRLIFKYVLNSLNQPVIHVQKERVCPKPLNVLAISLGVTGGIIGIGFLLLLILKLLTLIHDQREWSKFEKERQMARWDEGGNPIYKQPTSTFMNPTYGN